MHYLRYLRYIFFFVLFSFYLSCSDDSSKTDLESPLPPPVEIKTQPPVKSGPVVYIEELDQYQEYFKEQHETSFSHVSKKNWTSYTAGKDGILTKVLLFGKPNYTISEHYGSSMSGFVRANNPDSGPKFGEWSITRDEIVNQLAMQGLTETDRGWITLQMKGEIPQQAGKMYFIVCDNIGNKRAWFGAFAFAEGNPYKKGRFWLHPEHDLVFRTYVGKTADQLEKEQLSQSVIESENASLIPSNDIPEPPKPMIELSKNFEPSITPTELSPDPEVKSDKVIEPLYQPATTPTEEESKIAPLHTIEDVQPAKPDQIKKGESTLPDSNKEKEEPNKDKPKGSLFERFFKDKSQ